jgi:hypothetical protein
VNDDALRVAIGKPLDSAPRPAVGDLFDGEVEFVAGDEMTACATTRLFSGSTATLAPMNPILTAGLIALIFSAVLHPI